MIVNAGSPRHLIDVVVFASPLVRVGRWRCPADHPHFLDSGPSSDALFAFPREGVWIEHEGRAPFVADVHFVRSRIDLRGLVENRPPDTLIHNPAIFQIKKGKRYGEKDQTRKDCRHPDSERPPAPPGTEQSERALPTLHQFLLEWSFQLDVNRHFRTRRPEL